MRKLVLFLVLCCIVLAAQSAVGKGDTDSITSQEMQSVTPDDKKAAAAWYKEDLVNKKKALALFKKIKDEKSAKKIAPAVLKLYGLTPGEELSAMGTVGERQVPTGPAMEAEAKKTEKARRKLQELILKEQERAEGIAIEDSDLVIDLIRAFTVAKQ